MQHKRPDYRLMVDGQNITPVVNGRLIELTLDEHPGDEADTISMTLSDHDNALEIPPKGAKIDLAMGWHGQPLIEKGQFVVDEAVYSWAPNRLQITARSADMREQLPARNTRSWNQTTIGNIVRGIAAQNNLDAVIRPRLAEIAIEHIDQTDESDLNFLTRLGERHDAIAAIKAGRLLFTPRGESSTATGQPMPEIVLTIGVGDSGDYREKDRDGYTGVVAFWNDIDQGQQRQVMAGTDERVKRLRATYATQAEADAAAWAELKRLKRGQATLNLTLAHGRPELAPEYRLRLTGAKPQISERSWVIAQVSHSLTESGLQTALSAETLNP